MHEYYGRAHAGKGFLRLQVFGGWCGNTQSNGKGGVQVSFRGSGLRASIIRPVEEQSIWKVICVQDEHNLNLLGIFHYILGGITALFACLPIVHLAMGLFLLLGNFDGPDAPPAFIGWLFVILAAIVMLFGWSLAVLMIAAGRKLQRHRAYRFCFAVACLECIFVPLGTVLGVFTIVALTKDTVKELFGAQ